jgi:hypothetical protein
MTTQSNLHPKFQSGVVVISGLRCLIKSTLTKPQHSQNAFRRSARPAVPQDRRTRIAGST